MKGIVFTELLEMVENTFSVDIAEEVLESADLPSGGVYTAVGTYNHLELTAIVGGLSRRTGIPVTDLVIAYGKYLFPRFAVIYPAIFAGIDSALDFMEQVESHIHVEVRKLYPDAELPSFETRRLAPGTLLLTYRSPRPLAVVAEALIRGCADYFGENLSVERHDLPPGDGSAARFLVRQVEESIDA